MSTDPSVSHHFARPTTSGGTGSSSLCSKFAGYAYRDHTRIYEVVDVAEQEIIVTRANGKDQNKLQSQQQEEAEANSENIDFLNVLVNRGENSIVASGFSHFAGEQAYLAKGCPAKNCNNESVSSESTSSLSPTGLSGSHSSLNTSPLGSATKRALFAPIVEAGLQFEVSSDEEEEEEGEEGQGKERHEV